MKTLIKISALFFLSTQAFAQEDMTPGHFAIKDIRPIGSGCPNGSVSVNISDDKEAFTVSFSSFIASAGPGIDVKERHKNCNLIFDTEQDKRWEYAVLGVSVRGFAQLDDKVNGSQAITYGFKNKENAQIYEFRGPTAEDYVNTRQVPLGSIKWSGCTGGRGDLGRDRLRDYSIVTNIKVNNDEARQGNGLLTVDTADGQVEQVFELLWRQCDDGRKKWVSTCELKGRNNRVLYSKGMGRNENASQRKAKNRLQRRCDRVNKGRFGNCDINQAVCSTLQY